MYLDHAATTTLRPEARAAMDRALDIGGGNASGTHAVARAAKNLLEEARERAAALLDVSRPHDIVFTSGGTESDNLAVIGASLAAGDGSVVVSAIEHKAVLESAKAVGRFGYTVREVRPDAYGVVHPDAVERAVDADTVVVSVMAANNEVGVLEPIAAIAEVVRRRSPRAVVHTDAVQAFVGSPVTMVSTDADLVALSAHKFGGPKGVGLLAVRPGTRLDPIVHGGGHEAGRRAGTSNVPGIVGMVAAMEATVADRDRFARDVGAERDAFEGTLLDLLPHIEITARTVERMPHFSHVRVRGISAETLLILLDRAGMFAAAGSSCQSGAVEPSHVLTAMGMTDDEASECVRFTFGWDVRPGDGRSAADTVAGIVKGL
jgi:cysteine desulfurase